MEITLTGTVTGKSTRREVKEHVPADGEEGWVAVHHHVTELGIELDLDQPVTGHLTLRAVDEDLPDYEARVSIVVKTDV